MRRVKELCKLVWFSTWPGKYSKKYLGRSMGSFRTCCLTLKSLILMPDMASLQHCHPQQLYFMWHCCHHPCPSPCASQAVTLGEQGGFSVQREHLGSSHHCWSWLWGHHSSSPCSPSTTCTPHRDLVLVQFLRTYCCIEHFILRVVFFVTFTPTLHLRFVINHNCLVNLKVTNLSLCQSTKHTSH